MYKIYNNDDLLLHMTKDDAEATHYVDALAEQHVGAYVVKVETNEVVYKRSGWD